MVILFAEPRKKIRPGWGIYFSAIKLMGALQKFTDCGGGSPHLETLLDDKAESCRILCIPPLSSGIQFPVNFAI